MCFYAANVLWTFDSPKLRLREKQEIYVIWSPGVRFCVLVNGSCVDDACEAAFIDVLTFYFKLIHSIAVPLFGVEKMHI